jgi:CheY-like chemotaxis protein
VIARDNAFMNDTSRADPRPLRVLVIDDDPVVLETLVAMLEASGHRATTAEGGQAGIEAFIAAQADGAHFSVVLTDLGMPGLDGRAVANAIKRASPATPVILLTGWGEDVHAGDPGIDLVMAKPPRLGDLRAALARFVQRGT